MRLRGVHQNRVKQPVMRNAHAAGKAIAKGGKVRDPLMRFGNGERLWQTAKPVKQNFLGEELRPLEKNYKSKSIIDFNLR